MVIDYQAILAVLTIVCGIFLGGRFLGKLESKLEQKTQEEDDCRNQLTQLHAKFDAHLLSDRIKSGTPE